jgi:signal recognition particle subunit SRP54
VRKLGSLDGILKLIPGMSQVRQKLGEVQVPEKEMARVEAIIGSMTKKERENPKIINPSRRERIAKGSGVTVLDVTQLLKNFTQMQKMMKRMMGGGGKLPSPGKMPKMPRLPGGMPGMPGGDPGEAPAQDPRFARAPGKSTSASKRKKQKRKKR